MNHTKHCTWAFSASFPRKWESILSGLMLGLVLTSCEDERTPPTKPIEASYNETLVLLDRVAASGQDLSVPVVVRDSVSSGRLNVYCFVRDAADIEAFNALGAEVDSIDARIADVFDPRLGALEYLEAVDSLTVADSAELDSLRTEKAAGQAEILRRQQERDSLDVILDDRYKVAVRLNDGEWVYPRAVLLGGTTRRNNKDMWSDTTQTLDFLDSTAVWGQGVYLSPAGQDGWMGRRFEIDLAEFWIADLDFIQVRRPVRKDFLVLQLGERSPDQYTRYEMFPIRNWIDAISPDSPATLHIRFGDTGINAQVSATLYLVHDTKG